MGNNFDKTKELLEGVKGPTATAIKTLAMDLDQKFESLEKANEERHRAVLEAIKSNKEQTDNQILNLKKETDERFSKLKVVMFFSEHSYLFWIVIVAILVIAGLKMEGISSIIKFLK